VKTNRARTLAAVVFVAASIMANADTANVAMFGKDAHPVTAPQIQYVDSLQPTDPVASSLDYSKDVVYLAEGQNPDTTPVVKVQNVKGEEVWIPEEDPNGGSPTQSRMWLDNSPLYSGGWMLRIDSNTGVVQWIDVQERLYYNPDN